jgi:tetratricopeptide (TPR) repeat protein
MKRTSVYIALVLFALVCPSVAQFRRAPVRVSPNGRRALNSQTDVLGQEVLSEGEPSLQKVGHYFPPMLQTRVPISVKDHPDEFIVGFDGSLLVKDQEMDFRVGDPPNPYGADGDFQRSLLDGFLPIPQVRWSFDGLSYEETAFGYSKGLSPDEPLQAFVRFRITNPAAEARTARVTVYLAPSSRPGANPSQSAVVAGHGHADLYFSISFKFDPSKIAENSDAASFDARLAEVRSYWHSYLHQGTQIETPEPFINNAWRAWELYNTLNVDKVNGLYEIHDGSGFYEEVFGYSAALYCQALSMLGHHEDAEKYIESMLAMQKPNGQYISTYGTPDNGALLYAIGQEYRLSRNDAWFRRVFPKALKSMQWIQTSRATTQVLDSNGHKPLGYGLLPAGPAYCDFQNLVVSYYSDAYNWLGLNEMALALRQAGMQEEAKNWAAEAGKYHQDILESMQAAVFQDHGVEVLPIEPLTHRLEKQGSEFYYSLIAPLILETEFFSATDPHYRWVTDFMEQRGGLLLGLARIFDQTDHAYTYGYAMEKLRHGKVDDFLLTFYGSLAYGMTQDTYSAVEGTRITEGLNEPTLPHTYSNTQQLRMLRMMLVKEEAGELWLAAGTPRAWLDTREGFAIRDAPTDYGTISYQVFPEPNSKQVRMSIESSGAAPSRVRARLAANFGTLESATINGTPASIDRDTVIFDGSMLHEKLEILARYK